MLLNAYKDYILSVAEERLKLNQNRKGHVSHWGDQLEKIGAAGELAARLFLGLSPTLSNGFDNGIDLYWRGYTVDVKTVMPTKKISKYNLRIPLENRNNADIYLLMAVDLDSWKALPVGWATREDVMNARINREAYTPCRDIPVDELHRLWELIELEPKSISTQTKTCPEARPSENRLY